MSRARRRIVAGVVAGLLSIGSAGCEQLRPKSPGQPRSDRSAAGRELFGGSRPVDGDAIVVVQMQFDVLRVELPADPTHHSDKIWNHVEELCGDPARTALLRRNGLRMGVAAADAWAALRGIFDASGATAIRATHLVRLGQPLTLDLGPIENEEAVFLITDDHRLTGTTFDRGNKYLHLDYAVSTDSGGGTTIRMTPEIHRLSLSKRWRNVDGDLRQAPDYEGKVYGQLSYTVEVPSGAFLVIGPDTGAIPLSVGRRFLTRTLQGRTHETILCITPQPFRREDLRP